jgi:hypothetical protein
MDTQARQASPGDQTWSVPPAFRSPLTYQINLDVAGFAPGRQLLIGKELLYC